MENLNNSGIHVFEQNKPIDWEKEIMLINLLSVLSWKRFHGPIRIYCNSTFKKTLENWGLDTLYDEINVDLLENKRQDIDYDQFWAFSKLIVINHLKGKNPYTLIDNDLWLNRPLMITNDVDVMMYHKESFDLNYFNNTYIDFDSFTPEKIKEMDFDKSINPTNTALLYINNQDFLDEWFELSLEIANFSRDIKVNHQSTKMCFVEQRLLPMLLEKKKMRYGTFTDHIYQSHLAEVQDGSEWFPRLNHSTPEQLYKFHSIKHVWGLKKFFKYKEIRDLVMSSCFQTLKSYDLSDKPYTRLYELTKEDYQDNHSLA